MKPKSLFLLGMLLLFNLSCHRNKNLILKYQSGKVKAIWTYEQDTLNGLKQSFWENGHRHSIVLFKKGKQDGRFKTFYENGFIARAGEFNDGKLHGYHYKYSMVDSGQIIGEEYIINANNRHYFFYVKNFDPKGALVDYQRFLIIELNEKSVHRSMVFKYVGDETYDSMKIICCGFSIDFKTLTQQKLDTANFANNLAVVRQTQLSVDAGNYIRGKLLGYKSVQRGDTITSKTITRYFEVPFDSINNLGTEIVLSNNILSSRLNY